MQRKKDVRQPEKRTKPDPKPLKKSATKKPPVKAAITKKAKETSVKKIYKTTDGFLSNSPRVKKQRRVAAVEQRKKDGAIAVVKIFSKEGKEEKIGKDFIPNLELSPEQHSSLTETSIIGRNVIFGIKNGSNYKLIFASDLEKTDDFLTKKELSAIRKAVHNCKKEHRKTYKKKRRKWLIGKWANK